MDTRTRQTKIQTAFRFDPEMLRKMKNNYQGPLPKTR